MPNHWPHDSNAIRQHLKKKLGTDLTVRMEKNPFWHTGVAVPIMKGDVRQRRPWVFMWRVALGMSKGYGRATFEMWVDYVRRFVRDHMFPY